MDDTDIVDRFRRAAFGMDDWHGALGTLADATQASVVHLSGLDPNGAVAFNMIRGATPDMFDVFVAEGGFDGARNPRTRVATGGTMLRTVVDEELMTERERRALPIFDNLFERAGASRSALTRLDIPGVHATVAVMRARSFADCGGRERRLLDAIAPALSGIVTQAIQLGNRQDHVMQSTAESLERSVLLLDGMRRIVLTSQSADHWLGRDGPLTVRTGQVRARDAASEAAFATAIAAVLDPDQSLYPGRKVVLRSPPTTDLRDGARMVVTVSAVPRSPSGPLGRARVMVSGRTKTVASAELYATMFDLTPAEAQVAVLVAQGHHPAAIAMARHCSVLTVRTQIKALFDKTDTNRQGALVACLHAVG
ncbi:helix-turn-helix transcriptional regulator [Sphingomonas sp. 2R-10]|uniref:helix-turn-helix transcriptional regulator n=1 Tax=Sphingomonas sp. 2R-10 TaxID=3045148 RepID=UPI000F7B0D7F|nr:helix-turn-helix transcriptional regulator [Sphingomonas sp. 2R-10]MDJ0275801.1 helix-turn-helix transcriptional regulator [Sphingomonas sp. 2R-10]